MKNKYWQSLKKTGRFRFVWLIISVLIFILLIALSLEKNKKYLTKIFAEGKIVIVDGSCEPSMCTGRKTSDGKQVCA